ncbi:type 1 fimbrial protein [Salmonella enterica subsp. enterica serovar Sandiego]|nr:type 1 fimbrial protein [Salmonella enterica subsp. enterica serovar Sandiego]EIT4520858.1 type 1 fimbrial protein [Salmonella enterica subsp. enterica serovar Sandiego]
MRSSFLLCVVCLFPLATRAGDGGSDSVGEIYVHGILQENTCSLEMDSAWQEVDMGVTTHSMVNASGKRTQPVNVTLYLRDCPEVESWSVNNPTLTKTWSTLQPGYQARFEAVADESNPDLIAVKGASGVGLRMRDNHGRTVKLSAPSSTVLLSPGQNEVKYALEPVRTQAVFRPGAYYALIYFSMNYQ